MSLPDTARSVGLGKLALRFYHTPVNRLRDCFREGGPWEQRRTARGRQEMARAAASLPVLPAITSAQKPLEVHFLTGQKYWYQTIFCLWTLARHSGRSLMPVIYDDGTLAPEFQEAFLRLFPSTRFQLKDETASRLEMYLPTNRYPVLRERWSNYPHLRKLTDVHAGRSGWKLVLDSDLLFFHRPDFLLEWLDRPGQPLHAVDVKNSYGYPRPLLNSLAAAPLADLVNVGLCGLNSIDLDWEKLEFWCRTLLEREGTSYYLEQALVAMLVAGRECMVAPTVDYVTLPCLPEARDCRAVMHHYVAESTRWYFQNNWRRSVQP